MLSPRAGALVVAAAVLALLPACTPGSGGPATSGTAAGLVVVTAGGTALVDGQADVPPTFDLRVATSNGVDLSQVHATLDNAALSLTAAGGGALTATTAPMPLGSAHTLLLDVPGRSTQRLAFHVAPPAGAMAGVHTDSADGTVLDLAFQFAPADQRAVNQALPAGATVAWPDTAHLRAAWPTAPGGTLSLPGTLATARGSHLAATLSVPLTPVADGALRRVTVPASPATLGKSVVVAFTVATAASRASLDAHADRISVASPTGLHIAADGSLTGDPDAPAVATAATHRLPIWPLIQNDASDSAGIAAILEDRNAVNRLVSSALQVNAPGLHLDIEGVPAADRDHLSALVRQLATALHAGGRKLAVAVVPHKPGHLNVYSAAYDLQAISSAADLVTLMAYDEHTGLTDPGAVAGLAWDQQLLAGSLAEMKNTGNALLGLPLYARTWEGGGVNADSYAASVMHALATQGARVDYDFAAATPFVHFGDGATAWFDDAASLAAKSALVGTQHLRGIALWRLGFEDPAWWNALPQNPPRP
jgi:spore germination protein YaaH